MAYTFVKAERGKIGNSLCEDSEISTVLKMKEEAKERGVKLLLPTDTLAASEFSNDAEPLTVETCAIPDDMMGLDIGPISAELFTNEISEAGTIVWNGPMGVFEFPKFAEGTRAIANAVAESGAISIIGGGDSAAAVRKFGLEDKITHISTGGGASLEFMEGKVLPGIACLLDA
jgi:3-phosphoglycerate kinase